MKTIEAMKLALATIESAGWCDTEPAITALREALASEAIEQPAPATELREQEPVAWGVDWGKAGDAPCVSIIKRLPGGGIEVVAVEYGPQRTWVHAPTWRGLTDEEVINAMPDDDTPMSLGEAFSKFAKLIEAKLKAKNSP
jgi:hypothetical protein